MEKMGSRSITINEEKFNQLLNDVALMKEILFANQTGSEGEITDWVRRELEKARKIPDSELISSEKVKQMILTK